MQRGTAGPSANEEVEQALTLLRNPATIRTRAQHLLERARQGKSKFFAVHDAAIEAAASFVARLSRTRYPGRIPPHSRWRHFEAEGVDLVAKELVPQLRDLRPGARWMVLADLCIVSVLLDAGAGSTWRYCAPDGSVHQRSEGLALASLYGFCSGMFSHDPQQPLQVTAQGLQKLHAEHLAQMFQSGADNALPGFQGRLALLRSLGELLEERPGHFSDLGRPCGLLADRVNQSTPIEPGDILGLLLERLAPIWPSPNALGGVCLGDCWRHPDLDGEGLSRGWMPFHKLSQWLAYSLGEALQRGGIAVAEHSTLTGLAEYRNGGLMLDTGILVLKDPRAQHRIHTVDEPLVVEWRALTVALLEELAEAVRLTLGLDEERLPLACVLEGGTWAAGRLLARERRQGEPPLNVQLTGTVF